MLQAKKRPRDDAGAAAPSRPSSADAPFSDASGLPLGGCVPLRDYETICRVGEGTFGLVYKARHRRTGNVVAMKKVILHYEKQDGVRGACSIRSEGGVDGKLIPPGLQFPVTSLRELRVLKMLRHPNIVQIYDVAVGRERDRCT